MFNWKQSQRPKCNFILDLFFMFKQFVFLGDRAKTVFDAVFAKITFIWVESNQGDWLLT